MWRQFLETIPIIATNPLAILALLVLVSAWLAWLYRLRRSKDFIEAADSLPKRERAEYYRESGYTYDELASLPKDQRAKYLVRRYLFFSYLATLVCIALLALSIINSLNQTSESVKEQSHRAYQQAEDLFNENKFVQALSGYKKAINFNPLNTEAHYGAAKAAYRADKFDESEHHYQKALSQLNNSSQEKPILHAQLLSLRALHKRDNAEYEEALNDYNMAKTQLKNCATSKCHEVLASIYANLANLNALTGADSEIEKLYEQAIAHDRKADDQDGLISDQLNLAAFYSRTSQTEKAISLLEDVIKAATRREDYFTLAYARWNLARTLERSQPEQAEANYVTALRVARNLEARKSSLEAKITGDHADFLIEKRQETERAKRLLPIALHANVKQEDRHAIASQLSTFFSLFYKEDNNRCAAATGVVADVMLKDIDTEQANKFNRKLTTFMSQKTLSSIFGNNKTIRQLYDSLVKCTGVGSVETWQHLLPQIPAGADSDYS